MLSSLRPRRLAAISALGLAGLWAGPAAAAGWEARLSDQGTVDAIGKAMPADGSPLDAFEGLVLLSVTCTDDTGKPLKAPSTSFMAYFPSQTRPPAATAKITVDGKAFTLAGKSYKDTTYYYDAKTPAGFLKALTTATKAAVVLTPGDHASTFDMSGAAATLAPELAKCRK